MISSLTQWTKYVREITQHRDHYTCKLLLLLSTFSLSNINERNLIDRVSHIKSYKTPSGGQPSRTTTRSCCYHFDLTLLL